MGEAEIHPIGKNGLKIFRTLRGVYCQCQYSAGSMCDLEDALTDDSESPENL